MGLQKPGNTVIIASANLYLGLLQGYGIAKFPDTYITPNTLFYTASTTKSFTAAAVSLLIDDSVQNNTSERISWTTKLADLVCALQFPFAIEICSESRIEQIAGLASCRFLSLNILCHQKY